MGVRKNLVSLSLYLVEVSERKLEKMYDEVQQMERPFTPNQVNIV
jgi:hypothetical protein